MNLYICQICGDAYIGAEKPKDCPFCGAEESFIKPGKEYTSILDLDGLLGEISKKNLDYSLELEKTASGLYACIAKYADSYEVTAMYKDLTKVEWEHANIIAKMLKLERPVAPEELCSEDDTENFKKTVALEENAVKLYSQFAKEAPERAVKILFTALAYAEEGHVELIKNYLKI